MKKLIFSLILILTQVSLFAQMLNKGGGGNQKDNGPSFDVQGPGFSLITGVLRDAVTKEPIEFASISLIRTRDSSAQCGMITGANGKFRFEKVPVGNYMPLVTFIGYRQYRGAPFVINHTSYKIDLGTIYVQPAGIALKEFEVKTKKQEAFEVQADKKVFNVDKNLTTVGGTATDVLKNIPSVTVDQDGNISLRGKSNVTILIDNRPSSLGSDLPTVLQNIPANAIENIEVITNPSAKYSAEGVTGIINIVLKKNKLEGYNGVLIGGLGSNSAMNRINKENLTGTLNFRTSRFNVSTTYSFRNDQRFSYGLNTVDTTARKISRSMDTTRYQNQMHFGKASVEYNINSLNTIGANISFFRLNNPVYLQSHNYTYDINSENTERYSTQRLLDPQDQNYMRSIAPGLTYHRVFIVPKHTLDIDFTASDFKRFSNTMASDQYIQIGKTGNEHTLSEAGLKMYNGQADYSRPIHEDYTLEAGYKLNTFDLDVNNEVLVRGPFATDYTKDHRRSSVSKTITYEHAVYTSFSGKYKGFDYQAGLRGEYASKEIAIRKFNSEQDSIHFRRTYPDLFPSAYVNYKLKKEQTLGLNYSRRVERPQFMQLIPVTDYSVPKQPRRGNPDLEPEYTHSMELSYSKSWEEHSVNFTFYDYYSTNAVTYFREKLGQDTTLTTFKNTSNSNDYGIELIVKDKLASWWDVTTSINAYKNQVNGDNLGLGTVNSYQGDIHVVSSFKPRLEWSKNTSLQLTGYYQSKETLIQGYIDPVLAFDFGLKKEWGKKKEYTFSLSIGDIFNQRKFVIHTRTGDFNLMNDRRFDSRTISISFMYRYGKLDSFFFKKKKGQENQNMMGGDGF